MKKIVAALVLTALASCSRAWENTETFTDAFMLAEQARPTLSYDGKEVYTINDWYGVPGYDVRFVLKELEDSTTIDILGADSYDNGFYYVRTGLKEAPVAGISPGIFEPNHTILSGFSGNDRTGRLWSYVYLYDDAKRWIGGHYYRLFWGEAPESPRWTVEGFSTLPGDPAGRKAVLEAYAGCRYRIRDWYGVEKYDLDFAIREDGGVEILDYYAVEDGSVWVQARRSDLGDPLIPQRGINGGLELEGCGICDERLSGGSSCSGDCGSHGSSHSGASSCSGADCKKRNPAKHLCDGACSRGPVHGRLHFRMTIHDLEDKPLTDQGEEFVFEW